MRVPKVIASDLDGTLLDAAGALSPRSRKALHVARERGLLVAAVTARPPRVFDEWEELAACLDTAICSNGAIVYDLSTREATSTRTLSAQTAAATARLLRTAAPTAKVAVETGFEVVAETGYARVDHVGHKRVFVDTPAAVFATAAQIVKLLVHDADGDADRLLAAARDVNLAEVEVSHSGGSGLLEVAAAGVSKATALQEWCAQHGVPASEVVAFGDAHNDVPMLAWAGRSFAVANAHAEAAASATDHTASNVDDGVAQTVEAMLREPRRASIACGTVP